MQREAKKLYLRIKFCFVEVLFKLHASFFFLYLQKRRLVST